MLRICLFLFCLTLPLEAAVTRMKITTVRTPDKQRQMIIEVTGNPTDKVEKIVIRFPKEVQGDKIIEGTIPTGWRYKQSRTKLILQGVPHQLPFRARLEMGRQASPVFAKVRALGNGNQELYTRERLILAKRPPLKIKTRLRGLLALPPILKPGDHIDARILNPVETPPKGTWTIAGQKVVAKKDPHGPKGGYWIQFKVPTGLEPGAKVAVNYDTELGLPYVRVPSAFQVRAGETFKPENKTRIEGCATRGVVAGGLCVAGYFPDDKARNGILVDGKPAGYPIAASSGALFIRLPKGMPPGKHVLSGDPKAGFDPNYRFEFEVIDVQAEVDKDELVEGQRSSLSFFVVGSKAPMKVRVINTTPDIITMGRNEEFVIETFGGGGNIATKMVESLTLGNFLIKYELAEKRCPCIQEGDDWDQDK